MQHLLSNRKASLILVMMIVIAIGACKENTLINSKIAPSNNAINVYDTFFSVITHTYYDDTAQTSTNISGIPLFQAVGSVTDPYFGTMTGATYFQVIPTGTNLDPNFFTEYTIDSAILVLPYSGFTFGDTGSTTATQTYQVFYLQDSLGFNTNYFSYSTKPIDVTFPLSDPYTVNVHSIGDSFAINTLPANYSAVHIPLKLNSLLARLTHAQDTLLNSANPYGDFISAFKGICVRSADTRQSATAIPYFQLDGLDYFSTAGILIYYHPTAGPDSPFVTAYDFNTQNCGHFNSVSKSYSHYPVNNLFRSRQTNDSVIALQNLPGASIDVKIPGMTKLKSRVLNKAELQFAILPGSYPPAIPFQLPLKIYPTGVGNGTYPTGITAGLTYIIQDYLPISSTTPLTVLDGYLHQMPGGRWVFTVDVPREVMASAAANNDTLHLQINGTQEYYGAFHMVAGGGNYADTNYRPKLFVVYSKLTY